MKLLLLLIPLLFVGLSYGAYGGKQSSVSILDRDSCKNGDYTQSYYDGACGLDQDYIDQTKKRIDRLFVRNLTLRQKLTINNRTKNKLAHTQNPATRIILQYIQLKLITTL